MRIIGLYLVVRNTENTLAQAIQRIPPTQAIQEYSNSSNTRIFQLKQYKNIPTQAITRIFQLKQYKNTHSSSNTGNTLDQKDNAFRVLSILTKFR